MALTIAATLAPEIDRTVLSVGTNAGTRHRDRFISAASHLTPPARALLPRTADFLLEGPVPRSFLSTRIPYTAYDSVEAGIDELIDQGDLSVDGESVIASASIIPALQIVVAGRAELARELWSPTSGVVDQLNDLTASVRDVVPPEAVVAHRHARLVESGDDWFRLYERLTTIRYLRADAHRGAWLAERLDGPTMVHLTTAWHGEEPADTTGLSGRGWWNGGLTESGREVRDRIEAATNTQNDLWLSPLGESTLTTLIELLGQLMGTPVPRPF